MTQHRQVAALPWIDLPEGPHVLLIRGRGAGRWLIPKGWAKAGLPDWEMAAREAFEEAGVIGEASRAPCDAYTYYKKLHFLARVRCSVDVYPLRVLEQRLAWPERGQRQAIWAPLPQAARAVSQPELAALIARFAP